MANPSTGVKRRRTTEPSKFLEDTNIWADDGNVVIGVEVDTKEPDTDKVLHLFKCHTFILGQHRSVFRDMLAIPPSSAAEDTYNGLPLVRLPDPCDDVKGLLRMLYDPIAGIPVPGARPASEWRTEAAEIMGPLRLSAKYDFKALHDRLAQVLQFHWPSTLEKWDQSCQLLLNTPVSNGPDAVTIINLAYYANVEGVLPAALYDFNCSLWEHSRSYDTTGNTIVRSGLDSIYLPNLREGRD